MRPQEEIEQRLDIYRKAFEQAQGHDRERCERFYSAYRALFWVLHPEFDDSAETTRRVNAALGIAETG